MTMNDDDDDDSDDDHVLVQHEDEMEEEGSFDVLWRTLTTTSRWIGGGNSSNNKATTRRDPRSSSSSSSSRVATVASAIHDVAMNATATTTAAVAVAAGGGGGGGSPSSPSPAQIYATAVATLEGTLQQHENNDDDDDDDDTTTTTMAVMADVLQTQSALLRILMVTVPHVSSATLAATLPLMSRVVRAVTAQAQGLLIAQSNATPSGGTANASRCLWDTVDGLGGISILLVDICGCTAEVVRKLFTSEASTFHSASSHQEAVERLIRSTLLLLWHDASLLSSSSTPSAVSKAARDALCGLVLLPKGIRHPAIVKVVTDYTHGQIDRYQKHPGRQQENENLMELLGLLNTALIGLDYPNIGGRLMTILADLLRQGGGGGPSANNFVAEYSSSSSRASSTFQILTINALLSTMLSLLESDHNDNDNDDEENAGVSSSLQSFATRVLASLVQAQPTLTYRVGVADLDLLESGRTIYGQVMLSSCQRVLDGGGGGGGDQTEVGTKLLPLVMKHLLVLSRPLEEDEMESETAGILAEELTQLFRIQLQQLKERDSQLHGQCAKECLRAVQTAALAIPFEASYGPFLHPIGVLMKQMDRSDEIVISCVEALINLRCDETLDAPIRRRVDMALGSIIEGIGLEEFWQLVDISTLCSPTRPKDLTSSSAAIHQSWIFDVMKESGSIVSSNPLRLSFFMENALPLARKFDTMYAKHSTSNYRIQVINLWSLFPLFCRAPVDLASTFPNLASILVKAMNDNRYPELIAIICSGLDVLASGVSERVNEFQELIGGDEATSTRNEAEIASQVATKLLPSLFKVIDSLHDTRKRIKSSDGEDEAMQITNTEVAKDATAVRAVSEAIASLARVASRSQVQDLFTKVVQRMLQTSQSEEDNMVEKMCSLLSLSQALVVSECLDESSISLLYRALKPIIRTDLTPPRIQKRAYKVLAEICKRYHSFVSDEERIKEILDLLTSTTVTSQVSARVMRLKCLTLVVEGYENSPIETRRNISSGLVGETLLCLKDSNAKTRDGAYKLLLAMAKVHGDSADFIRTVGAALGSKTPHMRSAAVSALSRLVFELCSDDFDVQGLLPSLLKTVLFLSDDPAREVAKSMVIFVRVSVAAATPEQLHPLLPDILGGLLKYHRGKDRFRAKIKIIVKKLVKMFGYDALMPHFPPSDTRLLTHMRKLSEREARQKLARSGQRTSQRARREDFDAMMDSDEEDSDDGRTLMTGMTGATRISRMSRVTGRSGQQMLKRGRTDVDSFAQTNKSGRSRNGKAAVSLRIKNDADGEVLDVKELTRKTVSFAANPDADSDSDMEFDASGKLVVPDVDDTSSTENNNDGDGTLSLKKSEQFAKFAKGQRSLGNRDHSVDSRKKAERNATRPGSLYKAKKAGGDVKKKGQKYEPYAYVQLDGRNYSRKNRRQAVEQMGSVVQRGNKRQRR